MHKEQGETWTLRDVVVPTSMLYGIYVGYGICVPPQGRNGHFLKGGCCIPKNGSLPLRTMTCATELNIWCSSGQDD